MRLVSSHNTLPCHRCNHSSLLLILISNKRRKPLKQSFCSSNSYFYSSNSRHSSNSSNKKSICVNNSSSSFNSSSSNCNSNSNRTYLQLNSNNKTCLRLNSLYKLNLLASGRFYSSFISCFLITIFFLLGRTNNPFAPSTSPSIPPSNQTQQQRRPSPAFNLPSTYEIHSPSHLSSLSSPSHVSSLSSSPAPSSHTPSNQQGNQGQKPFAVKKKEDENEALAALFADREGGQDTFGNIGALRFVVLLFKSPCFQLFSFFFLLCIDMGIRTPVNPFWQQKPVQATTRSRSSSSKITTNLSLTSNLGYPDQAQFFLFKLSGLFTRVFLSVIIFSFLFCLFFLSHYLLVQTFFNCFLFSSFLFSHGAPAPLFFTLLDSNMHII